MHECMYIYIYIHMFTICIYVDLNYNYSRIYCMHACMYMYSGQPKYVYIYMNACINYLIDRSTVHPSLSPSLSSPVYIYIAIHHQLKLKQ